MNHLKLKMIAGILLVFFAGIVLGTVGTHLYAKRQFERMVRGPAAFLFPRFMEKIGNELGLTPEQQKKTSDILGDLEEALYEFRKKHAGELDAIIERHFEMLKANLSTDQQEKLESFRNDFHRFRKRWLRPHDKFGPPRHSEARSFRMRLKQQLNLSDTAWDEVQVILRKDFRKKRKLFRRHWKDRLTETEFRTRMNDIQQETESALSEILTPDQLATFKALQAEVMQHRTEDDPPPPLHGAP
ncbi:MULTISPECIES: hypothetical protein [Desulfococcus]|jgi:hypothetical protein|uniref:Periplasmic heavy metal sensor n=1 Tax=Desulfococcus multivorans DSM 2059 TaxID=1121405 RepID=S7U0C0_DESML|nr:hypothetical protein [Desulfococcus multivorans]AOY59445.1 uncharacterized protein Dmul_26730 [Desulfococcus multivorans]AQV01649.1 hypothetical protein B2D07_13350 [Desulfococcus multivorans]EPR42866.1 hypothetical protein dsmv_1517 [Desulfococcus multivorans DSM 2059]MDX9818938.1 hypothetical protein [Desulfococcus multivorans]SKA00900.1 hypothetical protein SAMN02745446_02398 [Desulfococcus multivorans DSM 2059]